MKELIVVANMEKLIPKSESMVKLSSLMTEEDVKTHEDYHLASIGVKVAESYFFLPKSQMVPKDAIIQRDEQGLMLGIPAIVGG